MEWKDWTDKIVFIKLDDGTIFTHSKVLLVNEPFMSITDKFNLPAVINIRNIQRIKEEGDDKEEN